MIPGDGLILALDSSSSSGSVALVKGRSLIAERTAGEAGPHAIWLMGAVNSVLEEAGLSIGDVGVFAVATGPGSFTGLRIGISTVKGLAWPLGKKVIGVSTMKALACNLRYSGMTVCPVLDARKKEVYAALYRSEGGRMAAVMGESAVLPDLLIKRIKETVTGPVALLGSGLEVYGDVLRNGLGGEAVLAPEALWPIRASNIGLLAADEGVEMEPSKLTPVYLRKSEAELKRRDN